MNGDLGPTSATADRDVYARLIADLDAFGAQDYLRLAGPRIARIIAT